MDKNIPAGPVPTRTASLGAVAGYVLLNALALSLVLFMAFMLLWGRNGALNILDKRSADIVTRAVLRTEVSDVQAQALAQSLRGETPGLAVQVLERGQARSLLALQEPWMKELPEIEIGALPAILEIRHPQSLSSPTALTSFNDRLAKMPQVEFLMFNATGYEHFVHFARSLRAYLRLFGVSILGAALLGFVLFNLLSARLRGRNRFGSALALAVASTTLAGALSWQVFALVARLASRRLYALPALPQTTLWSVLVIALLMCAMLELKDVRPRRQRKPTCNS
jgi:hypothetical protein